MGGKSRALRRMAKYVATGKSTIAQLIVAIITLSDISISLSTRAILFGYYMMAISINGCVSK
jgi:hypothetical protein